MKKFRCKLCGFVVEAESLEEGYICPLCGASHDMFEEVEEEIEVLTEEEEIDKRIPIGDDNVSIARILEKCINCGRCREVCENIVGIQYPTSRKDHPACLGCGQCILNCPVGALVPKYQYLHVLKEIANPNKTVVVLTSPAVRVSLGEMFGFQPGDNVEGEMITALRKVGFDYVFDTTFGADLTIMEEATELVSRIQNNGVLPQFTSCCPAWVKYVEVFMSEYIPNLSTCKSPIGMQTSMIKTYFANLMHLEPENIVTVALTPCTAKKLEATREELGGMCDYVITASETGILLKEQGIDLKTLEKGQYDDIFGRGSGAGVIFGNTGGVMEAALRTAHYLLTGKSMDSNQLEYTPVRGLEGVKEASVTIGDLTLSVAVVHTIPNLKKLLQKMKEENRTYHFIEVMNCKGGCIGGGGQPLASIKDQDEVRKSRIQGLYNLDNSSKIRVSYENLDIQNIYQKFLGRPGSELAEKYLHTHYEDKQKLLKDKVSL